ncbi:hypothetical protein OE88DRAFT_1732579 [Heliocybe sulcata]|uniref:CoA-dependent acyltransferase n=1 Tax=Heliocybe sulcata TaxID=5364 RepID=A0A5C3NCC4_9AGAM|nr:hypothetical protein OE88DRAFT_1732579 [Heliocybe sulcata]
MNWTRTEQAGHAVYSRPTWAKEKFYYSMAKHQRGLANFTVQATVKTSGWAWSSPQFEWRLKSACTLTAGSYPLLLVHTVPEGAVAQIVYTHPHDWDEAYNVMCPRVTRVETSDNEEFLEVILTSEAAQLPTIRIFWTYLGGGEYAVALASPHCLLDAKRAMTILHNILKNLSTGLEETRPSDWSRIAQSSVDLLPPPLELVRARPPVSPETLGRCMDQWKKNTASKTNWILPPKSKVPSAEGTTRRFLYTFSEEDSTALFKKHKSLGVTNYTVLQAALWLATVILNPPTPEDFATQHCSALVMVDAAGEILPEWKERYNGCCLGDLSLSVPLEMAAQRDPGMALKQMMAKITEDMKFWRESKALMDIVKLTAEGGSTWCGVAASKGIPLANGLSTNVGVVDSVIARSHGSKASPYAVEITDVGASGRISEPQYFTRAWTFNGKYTLQVNYNDHYHEPALIEEFLSTTAAIMRSTLDL